MGTYTSTYALIDTAQDLPNPHEYRGTLKATVDDSMWHIVLTDASTAHCPRGITWTSPNDLKIEDHFPIHDPRFNPDDLELWVRHVFDRMFNDAMETNERI